MRVLILATSLLTLSLVQAHAQTLSPLPEPGLWRSEATTLVNGQDVIAAMREAQKQMLSSLPEEYRLAMEEMMGGTDDLAVEMQCITAEDASSLIDPASLMAEMREEMPNCNMQISQDGASRLRFTGHCEPGADDGFVGDVQGELLMVSSREMRSSFTGKGRLNIDTDDIPPGMEGLESGPLDIRQTEVSVWVSSDCGELAEM